MNSHVNDINTIARFLARRDISALTPDAVREKTGQPRADLLILLGGSIPHGCHAAGKAMQDGVAERLMVVGGVGHTTPCLRTQMHARYPQIPVSNRPEADIIIDYLSLEFGMKPECILRENRSANCGENASFALWTVKEAGLTPKTVLLMQDSSMQLRMDASFRKEWAEWDTDFLGYASYLPAVREDNGTLSYDHQLGQLWGMWEVERFLTLILGEIPRLNDTPEGYGPAGKGFITHVDIPDDVLAAFRRLSAQYGELVRKPWKPE